LQIVTNEGFGSVAYTYFTFDVKFRLSTETESKTTRGSRRSGPIPGSDRSLSPFVATIIFTGRLVRSFISVLADNSPSVKFDRNGGSYGARSG
jgi:hypothetical protein